MQQHRTQQMVRRFILAQSFESLSRPGQLFPIGIPSRLALRNELKQVATETPILCSFPVSVPACITSEDPSPSIPSHAEEYSVTEEFGVA
jgi:hypothetical protein